MTVVLRPYSSPFSGHGPRGLGRTRMTVPELRDTDPVPVFRMYLRREVIYVVS